MVNETGVISTRTIRRLTGDNGWSMDNLKWRKWAPWHHYRRDEREDGGIQEGVLDEEREVITPDEAEKVVYSDVRTKVPRAFYLTKKDAELHGHTKTNGERCPGCQSWLTGNGYRPDWAACREGLENY